MALNAEEQELFDFAAAALPRWFTSDEREREELYGAARVFGSALATVRYWFSQTLIGQARGPESGLPDWLNQHAVDRGSRRQATEGDPALRQRIRNVPDAITRIALLQATAAILAAEGIAGTAAMVELPADAGHFGEYVAMTGTGGTFVQTGTTSKFTPATLPWPAPPFRPTSLPPFRAHRLVISGAANGANNGTRTITGLEADAALVTNASGVAAIDPTVTWKVERLDVGGVVRDGWSRAFSVRGYRMARTRPFAIVLILPYGSTTGTESSVREMFRQKKGAGILARIERRTSPP